MQSSGRRSRRFAVLDSVILMAATIAACVWLWLVGGIWNHFYVTFEDIFSFLGFFFYALPTVAIVADPFLTAWTLAWCSLRLRGPRARWNRLVRQPGLAVGFVAILAWIVGGLVTLRWGADVHHGEPSWIDFGYVHLASATMLGGFGVIVTWAGAAMDGRWRSEAGWVDRLGVALGVGWITLGIPSGILLWAITGPFY